MATPHDPDQLLALALARMRSRHLRLVRTHEELLAAARRARDRAAETRQGLDAQRARRAETLDETKKLHARLKQSRGPLDDPWQTG